MNKNRKSGILAETAVLAAALAFGPLPASADSRTFVWTYEYSTLAEGQAEVEYYSTIEVPDTGAAENSTWKHQVELEYGLTPKTDIAMYQVFKQENTPVSNTFTYHEMKLRLRHRLAEKGQLPVDTLLYAEYVRGVDFSKQGELEGKLVLAKDFGRLNLAYNQVVEFPLEKPFSAEHSFTAGASWALSSVLQAGMEFAGEYKADGYYAGPTLAINANGKMWINFGYLAGLNPDSTDVQTRLIIGVPF